MGKTILDESRQDTPAEGPADDRYFPAFLKEAAAYERMLPEMLAAFPGWYVAIHGQELIDRDRDEVSLFHRVRRSHPDEFVLLRCVEPGPELPILMDSPEGFA